MSTKYTFRSVSPKRRKPRFDVVQVTADPDGKTIRKDLMSQTFSRQEDGKEWAENMVYELKHGKYTQTTRNPQKYFGDLADTYLTSTKDEGSFNQTVQHHSYVEWWNDKLGSQLLVSIDRFVIADLLDHYMEEPCHRYCSASKTIVPYNRKRSPASRNRLLAALRRVYKFGQEVKGWVESSLRSPAHQVGNLKENNERDRGLCGEQLKALLEACRESYWDRMHPYILGLATTGARKREWLEMSWDRVDLDAATAYIPTSKNGEPKTFSLVPELVKTLREMRTGEEMFRGGLLFSSPTKPGQPIDVRKAWKVAKAVIGWDGEMGSENYLRLHDLRHSVGFYLHQQGHSPLEIRDFLGHKKLQSTERYIKKDQTGIAAIAQTTMAGLTNG